jgi:hypothetical protein
VAFFLREYPANIATEFIEFHSSWDNSEVASLIKRKRTMEITAK